MPFTKKLNLTRKGKIQKFKLDQKYQRLKDSEGHWYKVERNTRRVIYWRCSESQQSKSCPATVVQKADEFISRQFPHDHKAKQSNLANSDLAVAETTGTDFSNLLNGNASVTRIIGPMAHQVWGVTSVKTEIFIVNYGESTIKVYDADNFYEIRSINVTGMANPSDIVYHESSNCLYVCDWDKHQIHEIQLSNASKSKSWKVKGVPLTMSLSDSGTIILVCDYYDKHIYEYTRSGTLVKEIEPNETIEYLRHAVKLTNGNIVVSSAAITCRVVMLNSEGIVLKSVGTGRGYYPEQFCDPQKIHVTRDGNLLIADEFNDRIKVYSSELEYKGVFHLPGFSLNRPNRIHLDETNRRFYIGEHYKDRVVVVDF